MKLIDNSTPVVVLTAVHHVGLGILRSLGRLGIRAYVVGSDPRAPAFASRYCCGKQYWNIREAPVRESVRCLLDFARTTGGRPILIPTSDSSAMFVAEHAATLR